MLRLCGYDDAFFALLPTERKVLLSILDAIREVNLWPLPRLRMNGGLGIIPTSSNSFHSRHDLVFLITAASYPLLFFCPFFFFAQDVFGLSPWWDRGNLIAK